MWNNKKVSVILPTYNEKDSIKEIVENFFDTGYVDEVVVVNNNAARGTEERVSATRAIQVFEPRQGYGFAIWRGLEEASGDLLVLCEPDGTFEPRDIVKFLTYSESFDAVWGTRTNVAFIGSGANMGFLMRVGNISVAKSIQFLYKTSCLTDVGCTFKLFHRSVIHTVKPRFTVSTQHFGPELMLLTILHGFSFVEIPVNYYKRIGKSSVTGNKLAAFMLAVRMLHLVFFYFLKNNRELRERQP